MNKYLIVTIIAFMTFPIVMKAGQLTDGNPGEDKGTTSISSVNFLANIQKKTNTFIFSIESGNMSNGSHLFLSYGLGLAISNYHNTSSHVKIDSKSTMLRVPILLGGLIGDKEKLHATVRGGVSTNFLIRTKINDEIQDLSETKRFGWNGVLRGTFGFNYLELVVEYDIPFQSGAKGMWLFGVSSGF